MNQKPKDPMVSFKGVDKKLNQEKGRERIQLYLEKDAAATLAQAVVNNINNPRGVKLDLFIDKRQNTQTGRTFDSAYCFIKATQDPPRYNKQQGTQAPGLQPQTNIEDVMAKLKQGQLNGTQEQS